MPAAASSPPALRRNARPRPTAGPDRLLVVGSLAAAVAGGSLLGLVVGVVAPPRPPQTRIVAAAPTATDAPTSAAPTSPSISATPSPSASITTVDRTEDAPPGAYIDQPWDDGSLRLTSLEAIRRDGDRVVLTVAPARLLTGARAKTYLEQQGDDPQDYAVAPGNGPSTELTLRDDATIFGEHVIGHHDDEGDGERHQYSRDEFLDLATHALERDRHPALWLKRSFGIAGPLIYVAEQYPA